MCFATGPIAEAARSISKSSTDASGFAESSFDLAVALDPDDELLQKAFAALAPGGTLYAEWRSRQKRSMTSIRRRLELAGFEQVSLYWPRPDPDSGTAGLWLPLEHPEVIRYDLENRPPARNRLRRWARAVRKWALWPRPFFKIAKPVASVSRRPGGPGASTEPFRDVPSTPSTGILKEVQKNWIEWGLGPASPDRLSMLLLTRGSRASGKAVALIFEGGRSQPVIAVKMPRIPESAEGLRREAAILRDLDERGPVRGSTPRVLAAQEGLSGIRVVETAFSGLPAFALVNRENFRELGLAAAGWLASLAGRPNPKPRSQWWPQLVDPLLADFDAHFGSVVSEASRREGRRILDALGPLPIVWEQRDFSPWNVLVDRSHHLFVVDWESAEPDGLPLRDLVYFLTYLGFSIDRSKKTGKFLESYTALLNPECSTGRIAKECLARYSAEVGVSAASQRPLRMLTWLLHSRSEYRELEADAGGTPSAQALRGSLFLRLWEEELKFPVDRWVA
jgi:phosphotransferase family enzyme